MLTYLDLQNRVLRWIDEAGDTTTTKAIVQDGINASHRRLLSGRAWPFMAWPETETFTTTTGVSTYSLNPNIGKIYHIWNSTTQIYLPIIPRREWTSVGVNRSNINQAPYGAMWGPNWPVKAQPVSVSALTFVSSSASDTTVTVTLKGITSTGDVAEETITMTGTSPVTSVNSYTFVKNLSKTGTWVGVLTVSAGSTALISLPATTEARWYPTLEFVEQPATGYTFTYNFQRKPQTLVNDSDIPETPFPYSEIHIYDTLLDLTTYNTELGAKEQGLWQKRYDQLFDGLIQSCDEEVVGAMPRTVVDMGTDDYYSRTTVYNP